MNYYAGSSFLVSCYVTDANTPQAKSYLLRTGTPLVFTALHALEVRNAFKPDVFRGLFAAANGTAAWKNLETDRDSRVESRTVISAGFLGVRTLGHKRGALKLRDTIDHDG
jgi:hypothetical protein